MSEPEQQPPLGGIEPGRHRIRVEFSRGMVTAIEVDGIPTCELLSPELDREEGTIRRIVWALRELATFPGFPFHQKSSPDAVPDRAARRSTRPSSTVDASVTGPAFDGLG